jgi:PhzF family phenazine biosynthesis protein
MRIRIIDAFTDRPFAGNPAAVCLLDAGIWPDETWMRQVAAEMNLSETAFAHPVADGVDADWALRWFTPTVEVDLCGHATLATAHALRSDCGIPGTVRFSSRSGILIAHTHDDGTVTLDFPAAPAVETAVPDDLSEALNAKPDTAYSTGALGDLLVVLSDEASVRTLVPDFTALTRLTCRDSIRGIVATAPAASPAAATTSSHASSHPQLASPRTRSPAVRTPPWPPTGRSAWAGTTSPGCRHPPEPA